MMLNLLRGVWEWLGSSGNGMEPFTWCLSFFRHRRYTCLHLLPYFFISHALDFSVRRVS